ncbi:hypothetical protein F3Y22_tig00109972pilonHSYRG00206 [Hibiscus syriacus]|uniref:Uncharacterized protein n=1 Tax=Hibiscus syriacus TaxID=106335 RepID=A0A6A3BQG8_HIBSY|nr:hypothetical protein F3Y22_tig00109972pilonHSYRG00206 [Hibiscus syriacus]
MQLHPRRNRLPNKSHSKMVGQKLLRQKLVLDLLLCQWHMQLSSCRCMPRGLRGDAGIVECAFVASQVTELPFFATKVRLGRAGAEEVFQLGPLNEYERYIMLEI